MFSSTLSFLKEIKYHQYHKTLIHLSRHIGFPKGSSQTTTKSKVIAYLAKNHNQFVEKRLLYFISARMQIKTIKPEVNDLFENPHTS